MNGAPFPTPLSSYPASPDATLLQTLASRIDAEPFNAVATGIFVVAILHTFVAPRFSACAEAVQARRDAAARAAGRPPTPGILSELLHILGEVELVFGLWALVLAIALTWHADWETATHYLNDTVNYTEPMFVVVIMALAATRPVVVFAERALRVVADLGGGTPAAWWISILTVAPILGSLITEPAAMPVGALLLSRQFYELEPGPRLKYATLGLLFVNVSIGGTLTSFAAPPVLMVARPWGWDTAFTLGHFGWRVAVAMAASTALYFALFKRELQSLSKRLPARHLETADDSGASGSRRLLPVPWWVTAVHLLFLAWTVFNAHYPAIFLGGFLFFLGFARATSVYQSRIDLRAPLLVGFFLGGLVIHGGLQGWWIAPVLSRLTERPLFLSSAVLTAFNDNALITYMATLVPGLTDPLRVAIVEGAVTGGGLTVIANAPNPAGQALLQRFFGGAVSPFSLFAAALLPTLIAAISFRLL